MAIILSMKKETVHETTSEKEELSIIASLSCVEAVE